MDRRKRTLVSSGEWKFISTLTLKPALRNVRASKAATSKRRCRTSSPDTSRRKTALWEAVKRGEAALARGDFLTHDQVGDRLCTLPPALMQIR